MQSRHVAPTPPAQDNAQPDVKARIEPAALADPFTQRVLPYLETIETPWGTTLIPADELQRVVLEWRRPARPRGRARRTGRPRTIAPDVVQRIRDAREAGLSLRQIADRLNADGTPTAHGGTGWWASTVRSILGG